MPDVLTLLWRTGRKNDCTMYAMLGMEPSDDDIFLGSFHDPRLTAHVVNAHNLVLA